MFSKVKWLCLNLVLLSLMLAFQNCGSPVSEMSDTSNQKSSVDKVEVESDFLPDSFDKISLTGFFPQKQMTYEVQFDLENQEINVTSGRRVAGNKSEKCNASEIMTDEEVQNLLDVYQQAKVCTSFIERSPDEVCTLQYVYSDKLTIEKSGETLLDFEFSQQPCHRGRTVAMCEKKKDFQDMLGQFKAKYLQACLDK